MMTAAKVEIFIGGWNLGPIKGTWKKVLEELNDGRYEGSVASTPTTRWLRIRSTEYGGRQEPTVWRGGYHCNREVEAKAKKSQ